MKIKFTNEGKNRYIEVFPSIIIGWKPFVLYLSWIVWHIEIGR